MKFEAICDIIIPFPEFMDRRVDRAAVEFVQSDPFYKLINTLGVVANRTDLGNFIGAAEIDNLVLTYVKGSMSNGCSMTLAHSESLKRDGNSFVRRERSSEYPELNLSQGGMFAKAVRQLNIKLGNQQLDGFRLPADVVHDDSGMLMGLAIQEVTAKNGVSAIDSSGIVFHFANSGEARSWSNGKKDFFKVDKFLTERNIGPQLIKAAHYFV